MATSDPFQNSLQLPPLSAGAVLHSYEIRTFDRRRHASLIMFVQCANDLDAILVAREFVRKGQALEIWYGERLVYRVGGKLEHHAPVARSRGRTNFRSWLAKARVF